MSELIYKTKGSQTAYYLDGKGNKVDGQVIADGTLLYLRNRECHLVEGKPNVFEIAEYDEYDRYILLDAEQVEYVSGNQGER